MSEFVFGIDVGGTTVKCGLFTAEGEVLDKWEIPILAVSEPATDGFLRDAGGSGCC